MNVKSVEIAALKKAIEILQKELAKLEAPEVETLDDSGPITPPGTPPTGPPSGQGV